MDEEYLDDAIDDCSIAVIGMSGRYPGADDLEQYWQLLKDGREGVSFFSDDELEMTPSSIRLDDPRYVKAKGILKDVEYFDAEFFGIPGREARWTDPQQRLFLETSWWALEDAGYDAERYPHSISVYAGVNLNTYLLSRFDQFRLAGAADLFHLMLANEKDHLATRVAYKLNLRGESITVQTSCSTSLVAVHLACQSLLSGQSEMALAGGVSLRVPQKIGYQYQEGLVSSPDGHCRAFDEKAQGTVAGNGVGVVVLKPLADALRDEDHIYALIKGSAVNNDGCAKAGYTAPGVQGQAAVIARALAMADVNPESIGMVEAHGTGTPLGDPIEVEALTRVFRRHTGKRGFCALGSVKSNIGHLDAAAGVAGLMKAVFALRHGQIPATLHFRKPNPALNLEESPFYVNDALRDWNRGATPRRCGLSSFGIGGTNVHMILEEAPQPKPKAPSQGPWIAALSARTSQALEASGTTLSRHLAKRPDLNACDAAFTLNNGRKRFPLRAYVVAGDAQQLAAKLGELRAPAVREGEGERKLAFLFPGQGVQSLGMAEGLLESNPVFRSNLERCAAILRDSHRFDLMGTIYPASRGESERRRLRQPGQALPALFAIEYSLARTWMEWGIAPQGLIGHSYGEYVAACVAQVFSLQEGLRLAVERGKLMQSLPAGAMAAVQLPEEKVRPLLSQGLAVAILNSPKASVVSGPIDEIEALEGRLKQERVGTRRLPVPFAYHSPLVEPIAEDCGRLMARIDLKPPQIPLVSNLSGDWASDEQMTDPAYWVSQMRRTVRFEQGLSTLKRDGFRLFLEAGPERTLTQLAKQRFASSDGAVILPSLARSRSKSTDSETLLDSLGQLWKAGIDVDWARFHRDAGGRRAPLPGYRFERKRYWIELGEPRPSASSEQEAPLQRADAPAPGAEDPASTAAAHDSQAFNGGQPLNRDGLSSAYSPPQSPTQQRIAQIWEEVLGVSGVGIDDSFIELGGDSLLGTQVFSRLSIAFPVELELQEVLLEETVAGLARMVESAPSSNGASPSPGGSRQGTIEIVPRDRDLPLSYGQEWLWSVDQAFPGSPAYSFPFAARVAGPLRIDVLKACLSETLKRHEVLRSRFRVNQDRPIQEIAPVRDILLPIDDLSDLEPGQRVVRARQLALEEAHRPFNLETGPLFRAKLVRLADDDHFVLVTMHHIVSDAWSLGIFARELSLLYAAFAAGQPSPLAELSVQYADFAAWQRGRIDDSAMESLLSYWKNQLAGAPQSLEIPGDRPRPATRSQRGARLAFTLPADLSQGLKALGRREKATLFTVLLSGFSALLHRLSGQDDILVGIPVAGRNRPEVEELIGCFINTLVIRTMHSGNPRFRQLLQEVRSATLEAYARQEAPFERVVRALQPQRSASHSPLVQALFDFQNIPPRPPLSIEGLEIEPMGAELATAKLDLVIDMWEREEGLAGAVEYSTDLFEASTIRRLLDRFRSLLASAVDDPETRIDALDIASEAERQERQAAQQQRAAGLKKRFDAMQPKAIRIQGGRP